MSEDILLEYDTYAFNIFAKDVDLCCMETKDKWIEIDFPEEYKVACEMVWK